MMNPAGMVLANGGNPLISNDDVPKSYDTVTVGEFRGKLVAMSVLCDKNATGGAVRVGKPHGRCWIEAHIIPEAATNQDLLFQLSRW